ncbi:hypothetical protein ACH5RR_006573 [Cinchona calisaya]|uniref:Uncharacterized protein n=1 Tax=Cinchona calisaya TaxID=153742 RepID=A0ABD3APN9_9GENT
MTQIKSLPSFSLVFSILFLFLSPISSLNLDEAVSTSASSTEAQISNSFQLGTFKHLATNSKLFFFGNRKIQVQIKRRGRSVRPRYVSGSKPKSSAGIRKQASLSSFPLNALLVFSVSSLGACLVQAWILNLSCLALLSRCLFNICLKRYPSFVFLRKASIPNKGFNNGSTPAIKPIAIGVSPGSQVGEEPLVPRKRKVTHFLSLLKKEALVARTSCGSIPSDLGAKQPLVEVIGLETGMDEAGASSASGLIEVSISEVFALAEDQALQTTFSPGSFDMGYDVLINLILLAKSLLRLQVPLEFFLARLISSQVLVETPSSFGVLPYGANQL